MSEDNSEARYKQRSMRSELSEENSEARSSQNTETIHMYTNNKFHSYTNKDEARSVKVSTILELDNMQIRARNKVTVIASI